MPQNPMSPRDQFLLTAGSQMLGQPFTAAPQSHFQGMGSAVQNGMNVYQTALIAKQEEDERKRKQKAIEAFTSSLDPSMPPQMRAMAGLLAQSPQGQQQLPGLMYPEPEDIGTGEYENFETMASAQLNLPRKHPAVQDAAAKMYMDFLNKPKSPLVSITNPLEKKAQELSAVRRDEMLGEAMKRADVSRTKMQDLGTMHLLLKGYNGGPLSKNFLVPMQGLMNEIGLDPSMFNMDSDTGQLQAAKSMEQRMVLGFRSTAEGAGMPGHLSDRDVRFLEGIPPGLGMTEHGREIMYKVYAQRYQNTIDTEKFWLDELQKSPYGAPPIDILQKVDDFKSSQSILVDPKGKLTEFGVEIAQEFGLAGYEAGSTGQPIAIPPPGNWQEVIGPGGEKKWFNPDTGEMLDRG